MSSDNSSQDWYLQILMAGALPIKISDRVYLLGSHEFNIYLVRGEKCALIEGGVSTQFPFLLKQLGYLKISPRDIDYLIVLHSHADHIMTFPPLQENFPWMQVAASAKSERSLNDERLVGKFKESDLWIAQSLSRAGLGDGLIHQSSSLRFPMNLPFQEGDQIDLGNGIKLKVLETPGHSPDAISLYFEDDEILFVSDTVGLYYPPDYIKPNYFYNLAIHEASLRRIQNKRAKVLCKGHQGVVTGEKEVQHYIQMAFDGIENFKKYVQEALDAGRDENDLSKEFTDGHQSGISAFFSWRSNFRLTQLLIKRTLEYFNEKTHKSK
jgi:glyoxylase-like metal-dependent hydrolase (beta-lactamase superfamily II)